MLLLSLIVGLLLPHADACAGTYADWTLNSRDSGSGTFGGACGMPDFEFDVVIPSGSDGNQDPLVQPGEEFDYWPWEFLFGEADDEESLRIGSDLPPVSTPYPMPVTTLTISFLSPTNPSGIWAFATTDLEAEDAVISASLDGNPIPDPVVAGWFRDLFDSKPSSSGSPHLPSGFDASNVAVVAELDSDGVLSDEILPASSESASAWFVPDTSIDTLTIAHRNRWGSPEDGFYGGATMHVYLAAVPEPSTLALLCMGAVVLLAYALRRCRSAG